MSLLLRVRINDEEFVVAGESSLGVLSAHVTAVGRLGPESKASRDARHPGPAVDLSVGGMTHRGDRRKDEHLRWGKRMRLVPGDVVSIEVLEGDNPQPPTGRHAANTSSSHGVGARRRWQKARELYFWMRSRFEWPAERKSERFRRENIKARRAERGWWRS